MRAQAKLDGNMPQGVSFRELGDSGLKRYGGLVYEEFLTELQGSRGMKVFREMAENDDIINAELYVIEALCRRTTWRAEPANDSNLAHEIAAFVESCMRDMSHTWEDFISEILTFFVFGWAAHEKVYKIRGGDSGDSTRRSSFNDNKIGWRKLPLRAQESLYQWNLDDNGGIQGMVQQSPATFRIVEMPIEKLLLFRTTTRKNNPEGRSILRGAYRSYYFKSKLQVFEAIGVERDLAGIPVAEIPADYLSDNATDSQKAVANAFKKIVAQTRTDEQAGLVLPQLWEDNHKLFEFYLLSTGGKRQIPTNEIIKRYDQRIAQTVLADLILIGHLDTGSYALMDKKVGIFGRALDSFLDGIADTMTRYAVVDLVRLNGWPTELSPRIEHSPVEEASLKELADYVSKLTGVALLSPSKQLEQHLRDVARLPALLEGEEDDAELDRRVAAALEREVIEADDAQETALR